MSDRETNTNQGSGNAARNALLGAVVLASWLVAQVVTRKSYLHSEILQTTAWVFAGAWIAWFVGIFAFARKASRRPGWQGNWIIGKKPHAAALLVAAAGMAGLCVLSLDQILLLAVMYGDSQPVEFRSRITRTDAGRGCSHKVTFPNAPLARDTTICAEYLPLLYPRTGDRMIVQEQVGALGGTVITLRRDLSEAR